MIQIMSLLFSFISGYQSDFALIPLEIKQIESVSLIALMVFLVMFYADVASAVFL